MVEFFLNCFMIKSDLDSESKCQGIMYGCDVIWLSSDGWKESIYLVFFIFGVCFYVVFICVFIISR